MQETDDSELSLFQSAELMNHDASPRVTCYISPRRSAPHTKPGMGFSDTSVGADDS